MTYDLNINLVKYLVNNRIKMKGNRETAVGVTELESHVLQILWLSLTHCPATVRGPCSIFIHVSSNLKTALCSSSAKCFRRKWM